MFNIFQYSYTYRLLIDLSLSRNLKELSHDHPHSQVLADKKTAADLTVKIFADGADRESMLASYANPLVSGFTTNPTLMRQAGVTDYRAFAPRHRCGHSRSPHFF